jgi:hypothetical protein
MSETLELERVSKVRWEGSFGVSETETKTMRVTAWICADRQRGGFEIYDIESKGEDYYAEGSLSLNDDGFICDYDGVYALDRDIIRWLDELGMVSSTGWFREMIEVKE